MSQTEGFKWGDRISRPAVPPAAPEVVAPAVAIVPATPAASAYGQVGARLVDRGFAAIPILPGEKRPGKYRAGKWEGMSDWTCFADRLPTYHETSLWSHWPDAGVGIAFGPASHNLVAIDIDTDDDAIKSAICSALPPTTLRKAGKKGETLFFVAPNMIVLPKPSSWNIDGKRVCDLLGPGRQTVLPPTLHMDTGEPYKWTGPDALDDVDPSELPELPADICERISAALAPFGYKLEIARAPLASNNVAPGDRSQFRQLNDAALQNLDAWVPQLGLYRCQRTQQGYAAVATWRASNGGQSAEKRKLNLHLTPKGINDFGDGPKKYTAIDLVMAAKGCEWPEAFEALSDALGVGRGVDIALKPSVPQPATEPTSRADTGDREPGDGNEHLDGWTGPNGEPPKGDQGRNLKSAQIKATPFVWRAPSSIPPRAWLYGQHMARKFVSTTVAPGGVGKSSLAIVEMLAMVTGRDLIGHRPHDRLRVWYVNLEDPREELERRIGAACLHYEIEPVELDGMFVDSGREMEMKIALEAHGTAKIAMPVVDAVRREIVTNLIDLLIVDPFVSSHAVNENDNMAIDLVVKMWGSIADSTNCGIELLHHTRKGAQGQAQHTVEDGRGAVALMNGVRSGRVANLMSQEEARDFGIRTERLYFRLTNGKSNNAPPPDTADWYHLVSVDLGNASGDRPSDKVGVATRWLPPNPFDDVTANHLDQVMRLVADGEYRESSQAAAWVGKAVASVVGLDPDDPAAKAKIKKMLKTWLASGALRTVEKPDAKRVNRTFVTAGEVVKIALAPG